MRAPKCDQAGQIPTHTHPQKSSCFIPLPRTLAVPARFCLIVVKPKNPGLSPAAFCSVDYALLSASRKRADFRGDFPDADFWPGTTSGLLVTPPSSESQQGGNSFEFRHADIGRTHWTKTGVYCSAVLPRVESDSVRKEICDSRPFAEARTMLTLEMLADRQSTQFWPT